MKHGKLKLKHHLIDGLRPVLEEITSWSMVDRVIPGRIHRGHARGNHLKLRASVDTSAGIKLIAQARNGATQEVFIVTTDSASLRAALIRRGLKQ
jgi:hypothetical protein